MQTTNNDKARRFEFNLKRGGAHTSRTMMLDELEGLLSYVDHPKAGKTDYRKAIDDENCLGKAVEVVTRQAHVF